MWGISEYRKNNQWPSVDTAYLKNEEKLKEFAASQIQALSSAQQAAIDSTVKASTSSSTSTSFIPSSEGVSKFLIQLYETLFREVMQLFKPVLVQGHLDDLLGPRMFLEFILLLSFLLPFGEVFILFFALLPLACKGSNPLPPVIFLF
jgi:hypothetical protein